MNTSVTAIFEGGALRPTVPLELAEGTRVELIILREANGPPPGESAVAILTATPVSPTAGGDPSTSRDQSRAAFLRDLPQLLANPRHDGWWVLYHRDQRLGMGKSPHDLLREIQRRGISKDSYYLGVIRPHESEAEAIEPRHRHHFDNDELES
jgi:hypothetical protein